MNRPRYLAIVTAIATLIWAGYLPLAEIVASWEPLAPLLLAGGLLFAIALRPVRTRRGRTMMIAGWVGYIALIGVAFALATLDGVDLRSRGVLSLFVLIGVAGLMWSTFRNRRRQSHSYQHYYDR